MKSIQERMEALEALHGEWERLTIDDRFERLAEKYADRPYICTPDVTYTYRDTMEKAEKIARGLIALGVKPREHVAVLMGNRPEFAFLSLAVSKIGAVKVPVNSKLSKRDLAYTIAQSDASYLITVQGGAVNGKINLMRRNVITDLFGQLLKEGHSDKYPLLKKVIIFSDDGETDIEGCISYNTLLEAGKTVSDEMLRARGRISAYPDDIAEIMYTSGSTGNPKGVMVSHDMLWRSIYAGALNRAFQDGRRLFVPVPFFHMFGYKGLMGAALVGGAVIPMLHFDVTEALGLMSSLKANDLLCVPQILSQIVNHPDLDRYDLSALTAAVCTAAPAPVKIWEKLRDDLGVTEVATAYGMTELCGGTVYSELGAPLDLMATRVGKLLPAGKSGVPEFGGYQTQYKVVDPFTGEDLPEGSEGEFSCRGNVLTRGYYKKPLETAEVIDKDGWMRSGDIGIIHPDGYFELTGRSKEMYKTNGENVAPREIEVLLEQHPAVKTVAVVGVPDEKAFEAGVAFVELKKGAECKEEEIIHYCRENLAYFKVPKYVRFIKHSQFPRTANMKIKKYRLREIFLTGQDVKAK